MASCSLVSLSPCHLKKETFDSWYVAIKTWNMFVEYVTNQTFNQKNTHLGLNSSNFINCSHFNCCMSSLYVTTKLIGDTQENRCNVTTIHTSWTSSALAMLCCQYLPFLFSFLSGLPKNLMI